MWGTEKERDAGPEGERGERAVGGGGVDEDGRGGGGVWVGGGGVLPWSKVKLVMSAMTHSSQHALLTSRMSCSAPLSLALSLLLVKARTSRSLSHSGLSSVSTSISFSFWSFVSFSYLNYFFVRLILWTIDKMINGTFLFQDFLCKMSWPFQH